MVPCGLAPGDPDHACPTGGAAEKGACRDRSAVSAPARPAVERGHGGRGRLCGLVPVPRSDSAGPGKRCGAAQFRKRPYSLCQGPNSVGRSRLIDSTPLPCAASRGTVERSDLAGRCGYGYCRRHSGLSWGLRLYLVTTAEGMPVTRWLANPKLGKREVMTALLERDHRLVHAGQVILTDNRQRPRRRGVGGVPRRASRCSPGAAGPQGRTGPPRRDRPCPAVDRGRHRHLQAPAQPRTGRWQNTCRSLRPHRTTTPRPRSRRPAHLDHRRQDRRSLIAYDH